MRLAIGNGLFPVYLLRYALSMSAVFGHSLIERELCPLHPCAFITPRSASMSVLCVVSSSLVSSPVSLSIVKIVAYFLPVAEITLSMFAVVGIMGILRSHLYLGFSHFRPLYFAK